MFSLSSLGWMPFLVDFKPNMVRSRHRGRLTASLTYCEDNRCRYQCIKMIGIQDIKDLYRRGGSMSSSVWTHYRVDHLPFWDR